MTAMTPLDLGKIGYEAYAEYTGGKTYDGRDMPSWDDVGNVQNAWAAAAADAIHRAVEVTHEAQITDRDVKPVGQ